MLPVPPIVEFCYRNRHGVTPSSLIVHWTFLLARYMRRHGCLVMPMPHNRDVN
jgi:hypothetical protein